MSYLTQGTLTGLHLSAGKAGFMRRRIKRRRQRKENIMNIKKSNIITAVLCAAALSASSFYSGYAAGTDSGIYNSQGKIVFDNGTENTADDVVFDAADFLAIDKIIIDGKTSLKDELNQYDNIEINDDIPEFNLLAEAVGSLSDGTDAAAGNILSGKKALVGKSIITGNMDDHSGTKTSTSQIEENGSTAEITIPGGYYDENSKITVPIDVIKKLPTINSNLKLYRIAKPEGAPVTVPKAGCYIIYMSTQGGGEPAQPENTEVILEPTYFSVASIGVYLAVYMSTDVTSVACAGSDYNYVQGAIVLAP